MRRRTGRGVVWALAVGWAFAGGVVDPLAAEVLWDGDRASPPTESTLAVVATGSSATGSAGTAGASTAAQVCPGGSGFCVRILDNSLTIPFTGIGIRHYCDLCECTWADDGHLHRTSWWECDTEVLGIRV